MPRRKKKRVGVVFGGPSSEYEVSISSGHQVLQHLDREKYTPLSIRISKSGQWFFNSKKTDFKDIFKKIDVAFLALHGEFGEDGAIQSLLTHFNVPFTGSGVSASVLGMDKMKSRELFKAHGLDTPASLLIHKDEDYKGRVAFFANKLVKYPLVVKPLRRGSSVGVSLVKHPTKLNSALKNAFQFDSEVLLEEYLYGRELTCGVLENVNKVQYFSLPITEIIPKKGNKFFNYKAKYTHGAAEEITPAVISEDITRKIKEASTSAHKILGCSGYSRVDVICVRNKVYVLEVNTLPGLTENSLLPQQAHAADLTFSQLLDTILSNTK